MERNDFRIAAALLAIVIVAIGAIAWVRVSGAGGLRAAFADRGDLWGDDDLDGWERCYDLYDQLGLWGHSGGSYSTYDTHAETHPDGAYRSASLSIAFFDDVPEASRRYQDQQKALGQLQRSDCLERVEDAVSCESVAPSADAAGGIAWAARVETLYDESSGPQRREIYVWLNGARIATLDVWVDDTQAGQAFVRDQYQLARSRSLAATPTTR